MSTVTDNEIWWETRVVNGELQPITQLNIGGRPHLVIDPEDGEAVWRLLRLFWLFSTHADEAQAMRDAIRAGMKPVSLDD